jgi:hypothetical protein
MNTNETAHTEAHKESQSFVTQDLETSPALDSCPKPLDSEQSGRNPVSGKLFDKLFTSFLREAAKRLTEELRFKHLRLLPSGLFIEESACGEILKAFITWTTDQSELLNKVSPDKLQKDFQGALYTHQQYLLDGKALLYGNELRFQKDDFKTQELLYFQGSLLDARSFIHMRDPIFAQTPDVTAQLSQSGLSVQFSSRKQSVTLDNASLQKLAVVLQRSRSIPKRYTNIQNALREAVPAFCEIWSKANIVPSKKRLLIPHGLTTMKDRWFLTYGDLILVQNKDGSLASAYGLTGKNLHELLVEELRVLKNGKHRFKAGSLTLGSNTKGYGTVTLESERYRLDPVFVRTFLLRIPFHRELTDRMPTRYTLGDVLKQLVEILESSIWADTIHIPRQLTQTYPAGTSYRTKGEWIFALSRQKVIIGIFDKSERRPTSQRHESGLKPRGDKKGDRERTHGRGKRQKALD